MCFDQVAPHNTVVNFKPVHFGDRPRIGSDMTDLSPEHVGVVTRYCVPSALLQGTGFSSSPWGQLGDGLS